MIKWKIIQNNYLLFYAYYPYFNSSSYQLQGFDGKIGYPAEFNLNISGNLHQNRNITSIIEVRPTFGRFLTSSLVISDNPAISEQYDFTTMYKNRLHFGNDPWKPLHNITWNDASDICHRENQSSLFIYFSERELQNITDQPSCSLAISKTKRCEFSLLL